MGTEWNPVTRVSVLNNPSSVTTAAAAAAVLLFVLLPPPLCRLPSFPQPHSALRAPRGGSSALLAAHLPGERQRPSDQLQGVSESDLCGGKDPPTRGEVWSLQRSHGGFLQESVPSRSL